MVYRIKIMIMEINYKRSPFSGISKAIVAVVPDKVNSNGHGCIYQPSVIDNVKDDYIEGLGTFLHSDVHSLLHEKRLDSLGKSVVNDYLKNLFGSSGVKLPDNVTDNDLLDFVKSRYIQAPCDLNSYVGSLTEQGKSMVGDAIRKAQQEVSKKKQKSNNKKADDNDSK